MGVYACACVCVCGGAGGGAGGKSFNPDGIGFRIFVFL